MRQRNIYLGLFAAVAVFLSTAIFLVLKLNRLNASGTEFARDSVAAIAEKWIANELYARATEVFRRQTSLSELEPGFAKLNQYLGPLEKSGEPVGRVYVSLLRFWQSSAAGRYEVPITCKAAHGTCSVEIVKTGSGWRIGSFRVSSDAISD